VTPRDKTEKGKRKKPIEKKKQEEWKKKHFPTVAENVKNHS
jgi:hypothetical protein